MDSGGRSREQQHRLDAGVKPAPRPDCDRYSPDDQNSVDDEQKEQMPEVEPETTGVIETNVSEEQDKGRQSLKATHPPERTGRPP